MKILKIQKQKRSIMRNFIATHDPRFPKHGQRVHFTMEYERGAEFGTGTYYAHPARIEQDLTGLNYLANPIRTIPWDYVSNWFTVRGEGIKRKRTQKVQGWK